MGKISKSDQPINRNDHAEIAERAANAPRSTHFEVGTWISGIHEVFGQRRRFRAEILSRPGGGFMLVKHEDGTTEILYPQALAHESKVR